MWRWVVPVRKARSSWLDRRSFRQRRSSCANRSGSTATDTQVVIAHGQERGYSLRGIAVGHGRRHTRRMTTIDPDHGTAVKDPQEFADRYVALWNEPDPATRRRMIRELWAPGGAQVLVDPPVEMRDAADRLAFPHPTLEVRGYDAIEARVSRAYEMFIAPGEYVFEFGGDASRLLGNVVSLNWSMVSRADREKAGGGLNVVALGDDGRIRLDYLFVEV